MMRGRLSEQGIKRNWHLEARRNRLDFAVNPFLVERAMLAGWRRERFRSSVRSSRGIGLFGRRAWFPKPVQFKGQKLRARCATIAGSVARAEHREFFAWVLSGELPVSGRGGLYAPAFDSLCATAGDSLDAPICLPAGGCVNLAPFWLYGDSPPQSVVAREPWK